MALGGLGVRSDQIHCRIIRLWNSRPGNLDRQDGLMNLANATRRRGRISQCDYSIARVDFAMTAGLPSYSTSRVLRMSPSHLTS